MAPSPDPTPIKIKVSWLKQKLAPGTQDPILEFDEQQIFSFDPNQTTFKMVKHSCSYPAPPHKVRMWCSSFGASLDLPTSMELNVFINTFELIADEKHTLTMAHLSGGETVAFEMVQGDQFSELSRFLLGNNLVRSGKHGPAAAAAAVGGALPLLLPGSTGASPGQLQPLARLRLSTDVEPSYVAPSYMGETNRTRAEAASAKIAAELIAEEEEEKAKREKKKAKKKGKKEKQKGKRRALAGDALPAALDASDEEEGEEDELEVEAVASAAAGTAVTGQRDAAGPAAAGGVAGATGGRPGCSGTAAASRPPAEANPPARSSKAAAAPVPSPAPVAPLAAFTFKEGGGNADGVFGCGSAVKGSTGSAGGGGSTSLASVLIREAGAGGDGAALNAAQLDTHVQKCHALIRALVDACMMERKRKQALSNQLNDFEQAAAAQHAEYSADVQRLQARLDELEFQNLEYARMVGAR